MKFTDSPAAPVASSLFHALLREAGTHPCPRHTAALAASLARERFATQPSPVARLVLALATTHEIQSVPLSEALAA